MLGVKRRGRIPALVLVAVILGAACTGSGSGGDKAGGSGEPVVLRLGTPDRQGYPAANDIEEFARQVKTLSNGALRIQIVWEAQGPNVVRSGDQRVADLVRAGTLDV